MGSLRVSFLLSLLVHGAALGAACALGFGHGTPRPSFRIEVRPSEYVAAIDDAPPPDEVADERRLEREYLGLWDEVPPGRGFTNPGRQIVHCTFGSVLADAQLGPELLDVLRTHSATYAEVLEDHFVRHLRPLQV